MSPPQTISEYLRALPPGETLFYSRKRTMLELGLNWYRYESMLAEGRLINHAPPGRRPRFLAADVQALKHPGIPQQRPPGF